ncbi:MAG: hypothetical protein PHY42_04710 [Bacilli bacterium]|nr:hypothetical protein [Bacilli bacterium]
MKKFRKTIRLSTDNIQLLDIFHDDYYIEIGHADYKIITKLLENRVVKLDQMVHYDVQSVGLGHSDNPDEILARHLPYLYFMEVHEENQSMQVFLTYGLLSYYDRTKNEQFAPLVLIPISLFYENELFYMSIDANPLPNNMLITYFKSQDIDLPTPKLETIYDFMKYCNDVSRLVNQPLKLENYMTIAKTVSPTIVMNHDRFSLNQNISWPLEHEIYRKELEEVFFVSSLSYRQRQAVERASKGNSFAIVGPLGTGKTRTLYNIALDAIQRNRRVLYLSSQTRTLSELEKQLQDDQLNPLYINLAHSFNNAVIKSKYRHRIEIQPIDEHQVKANLTQAYQTIKQYEFTITDRILNFRFVDVLMHLILDASPEAIYPIDDLSNLYKHEYYEIIASLKAIENDLHKIPKFKESKFIHIPVNHHIEYPNQILNLLFQISRNFVILYEKAQTLEQEYHFAKIPNYARFKNVVNDIRGLEWEKVPSSWKKSNLVNYHKAAKLYQNIKSEIYSMQEQELYLDWDYQGLHEFDVDEAIRIIQSTYWKEANVDAVNQVLLHHQEILSQLRIGTHNTRVYQDAAFLVQQMIQWQFDPDDDQIIKLIIETTEFLKNHRIHDIWLNTNRYQELRNRLVHIKTTLKRYENLESQYLRYFTSLDDIDNNIISLVKMEAKGKRSSKFKGIILEELINDLRELKSILSELTELKRQYYALTGIEYLRSEDVLSDFDACYQFINSIQDEDERRHIVKFFSTIHDENLTDILQNLNNFIYSYQITNDIYNMVISYFPHKNHTHHGERRGFIQEINEYFTEVSEINHRIHYVIKKSDEIVLFEDYLKLRKRQKDLQTLKEQINTNKDYRHLYGKMFQGEHTNINEIGSLIKNYGLYIECFDDPVAIEHSLKPQEMQAIQSLINETDNVFDALINHFKTYSKLFNDGIGGFYYDDFPITIQYMKSLMDAKDELLVYLDLTNQLKTLYRYKLFLLSNLIINNVCDELVILFSHVYFNMLYERFIKDHPTLLDTNMINETLKDITQHEASYYELHLNRLRERHNGVGPHFGYHQLQYQDFIRKGDKPLYLATPSVLNHFLDISDFDLVIIDDAQALHANEYHLAIQAKQIVIAGEDVIHMVTQANLLTRMRSNYVMNLTDGFSVLPLQLSAKIPNYFAPFYCNQDYNQAIAVVNLHIVRNILALLHQYPELTINVYLRNLGTKRAFYEEFSLQGVEQGFSPRTIEQLLTQQLLVVDLLSGYGRLADINVLYCSEYEDVNVEYIDMYRLSSLLIVRKQLILFDSNHLLDQPTTNPFMSHVQSLFSSTIDRFKHQETELFTKMKAILEEQAYKVLGSYKDISMVIEKNHEYRGLIVYYDGDHDHYEMLEDHRLYQQYGGSEGISVVYVHILDLVHDMRNVIARFTKESNS